MFGANNQEKEQGKLLYKRLLGFGLFLTCLIAILVFRLFILQIVQTEQYAMLSNKNQVRIVSQPARRGNIYDKNQVVLADSQIVFVVAIASSEIKKEDREDLATNLAVILNDPEITKKTILGQIANHARKYEPIIVKRFPYEENLALVTTIEEHRQDLPGVFIIEEPQRNYPLGSSAGHILGQVGVLSEEENDLIEKYGYLSTDWIGKSGLEKSMERFTDTTGKEIGLRGKRGLETIEVDSRHRTVRTLSEEEALPGNSLTLTIDSKVQKVMEDSLEKTVNKIAKSRPKSKAGAGVLIDVKTGGIIAMASYPGIDPNDFAKGLSKERAAYYWDEDSKPLFNRAISAAYPSGSTFKPSIAMAVEAAGVVSPTFSITCSPSAWTKPRAKCPSAHGRVNLKRAMAISCNAFFQEVAYQTGIEKLYPILRQLGYGQLTGIELPAENKGFLANPEWKAKNFEGWDSKWHNFDTYYMSIGQGYTNNSTIQVANAIATIANEGKRMQNFLVDEIKDYEDTLLYKMDPKVVDTIVIPQENIKIVKEAMRAVCLPRGTAYSLFGNYPVAVAAKTGTAQTGLQNDDLNSDYHGWFVAFAPYDDPQVAFAGVIEYGYHGGTSAGQVCKAVFDEYFGFNKPAEVGINSPVAATDYGIILGNGQEVVSRNP